MIKIGMFPTAVYEKIQNFPLQFRQKDQAVFFNGFWYPIQLFLNSEKNFKYEFWETCGDHPKSKFLSAYHQPQ